MFNVGDEIVCVDDSPYPCGSAFDLKKGDVFTVLSVFPEGALFQDMKLTCAGISIGVPQEFIFRCPGKVDECRSLDLWDIDRFRKVERKRTREELYSLIGIDGMVDQRESVTAFHKFPCESASLRAPARQPVREMAVGVTVGSPRRVSRGTDGARLAVTLTRKGTCSLSEQAGRPVAAAQRIGTAEWSGDGCSVRSDQREGVAA